MPEASSTQTGETRSLTRNQALVLDALSGSEGPMSAYTILDQLRGEGIKAPLQVYRALEKLVERGAVHRLESLNAFVACRHPACEAHELAAFTICTECGQVSELADDDLSARLEQLARGAKLLLNQATVELSGVCMNCQEAGSARR